MKTAVEWLQDTWLNYPDLCSYDKIQEWFKQAKEMEKEQISNAYVYGSAYGIDMEKGLNPINYFKEKYSNE